MRTGALNKIITFYPVTTTVGTDGFLSATTYGTGVAIRCSVTMMSAYRKNAFTELVNAEAYEVECFANAAITNNSKAVYGSKTLYVHSIVDSDDKSFTSTKKLILYTK